MKPVSRNYGTPEADIFWVEGEDGGPRRPQAEAAVTFGIAELAKEFGVTLRALRFYESKGLLSPQRQGKERIYSLADRDRLALILKGKRLGFTLAEIRQMVAGHEGLAAAQILRMSPKRCREQIELLERQFAEVQDALNELRRIEFLLTQAPAQDAG